MALTTCPDCKSEVSTEAAACPKCGHVLRKPMSFSRVVGLVLLVLLVIAYFVVIRDYEGKAGHGSLEIRGKINPLLVLRPLLNARQVAGAHRFGLTFRTWP